MKRITVPAMLLSVAGLVLTGSVGSLGLKASAGGVVATVAAQPQAQTPRPIRTLPNLQSITIWGSGVSSPGGSGQNAFTFAANSAQLTAQLNDPLGASNRDFNDGQSYCDVFYSEPGGTLNPDGAYLTIEAMNPQAAGQFVLAEVGLNFGAPGQFEYGNDVASYVALGDYAMPASSVRAADQNRGTYARLGNTAGQSQRLRITIGFLSTSGPPLPRLSIHDIHVTEGNDGTTNATFEVTVNGTISSPVRVDYATEDYSAFQGEDYVSTRGTLDVLADDRVTVPVIGDVKVEPDETFFVNLSNPVGARIENGRASCTIFNDDFVKIRRCSADVPKIIIGQGTASTLEVEDDLIIHSVIAYGVGEPRALGWFLPFLTSPVGRTSKVDVFDPGNCLSPVGVPERSYTEFDHIGENARGLWRLVMQEDTRPQIQQRLMCWCLEFSGVPTVLSLQVAGNLLKADKGVDISDQDTFFDYEISVSNTAQVIATVINDGHPVTNAQVTFSVCDVDASSPKVIEEKNSNSRGEAVLTYGRSQPGTDAISAVARVNGVVIAEHTFRFLHWLPLECPIGVAAAAAPGSESTLKTFRSFRDNELSQTSHGRRYTELYYQFSTEAVRMLMFNPMLMLRSREIIGRYKPVIQSMVNGEEVTLTDGDLDEIEAFMNSFAAKGSPDLQEAIEGVCKDLRDPQVHEEFGITVTGGPKRSMSAISPIHTIRQTGGAAALMCFCVAFVFCFIRGCDKNSISKARRLLCVTIAMLLIGGQWSVAGGQSRITISPGSFIAQPENDKAEQTRLSNAYGKLPLAFEANQGHTDSQASFLSRGNGYSLLLMPTEAALQLWNADRGLRNGKAIGPFFKTAVPKRESRNPASEILRVKLIGANPESQMAGVNQLPGTNNYFIGSDPSKWRANVPTYARIKCEQVYPGIDMIYYGNQRELEYDFKVAPGADPRTIRLSFDRAERMEIAKNGDLVLSAAGGEIRQRKPVAYQELNGVRRIVPARYVIRNPQSPVRNQEVGFELGAYLTTRPLIIDPVLAYSTYLGGSGDDEGNAIAIDSSGNVYVVGFTNSPNFPTSGASQPTLGGGQQDVFVTKLNPSGTQLIYSTYLGGNGQDNGSAIAVDAAGNAYITGFTGSTNFPVRNAMQPAKNGPFNAFISKLDSTGSLVYSTHLGGSVGDYGSSIAVDGSGNVYVAGVATSPNFPMANPIQATYGGAADVYVAKLNPSGSQLLYSTYLGGAGNDGAASIAVDSAGNLYVTGVTSSPNFRTANPLQVSHGGGLFDAFVAKINTTGSQLIYSTYLGGSGEDRGFRITADALGNAYVTGDTDSINFPTTGALQRNIGGSVDAFVAKINPSGSALVYSTYLGGSGIDGGTAIALDSSGSAYVTGFTGSTNFPTISPVQQANGGGSFDAFVAKLSPSGSTLDYSTYLGGAGIDAGFGIAVDSSGNAYVMGQTDSTGFPTVSPLQPANGGGSSDVFIAKIAPAAASGPHITGASVSGKKLFVFGSGFDSGARVLLNGESQKTSNDDQNPATALIAKKSGNKITSGQTATLQVRNADGTLSNQFSFTR